jgi:hypothetical protein
MQNLNTLIRKFWNQTITKKELGELRQLLENTEGKEQIDLLENLECIGGELDPDKVKKLLEQLRRRISVSSKVYTKVKPIYFKRWWMSAAAILIVIISGYLFVTQLPAEKGLASSAVHLIDISQKQYFNKTENISIIVLSDKSIVKLYPGSSISFIQDFEKRQRNITLAGKAFFKVTKDLSRPFTVSTNEFNTIALGTEFTVDANNINRISVKLFEGNVVIKAIGKYKEGWIDQYLFPNQEFSFNASVNEFSISEFKNEKKEVTNLASNTKVKVLSKISLDFNNKPLDYVFDNLALAYSINLVYSEINIKEKYFTGSFSKEDNLKNILSIICDINGIDLTDKGEKIIIINKTK